MRQNWGYCVSVNRLRQPQSLSSFSLSLSISLAISLSLCKFCMPFFLLMCLTHKSDEQETDEQLTLQTHILITLLREEETWHFLSLQPLTHTHTHASTHMHTCIHVSSCLWLRASCLSCSPVQLQIIFNLLIFTWDDWHLRQLLPRQPPIHPSC